MSFAPFIIFHLHIRTSETFLWPVQVLCHAYKEIKRRTVYSWSFAHILLHTKRYVQHILMHSTEKKKIIAFFVELVHERVCEQGVNRLTECREEKKKKIVIRNSLQFRKRHASCQTLNRTAQQFTIHYFIETLKQKWRKCVVQLTTHCLHLIRVSLSARNCNQIIAIK